MTLEELKILVLGLPEDERIALAEWIHSSTDDASVIDPTEAQITAKLRISLAEVRAGQTLSARDALQLVRDDLKRNAQ